MQHVLYAAIQTITYSYNVDSPKGLNKLCRGSNILHKQEFHRYLPICNGKMFKVISKMFESCCPGFGGPYLTVASSLYLDWSHPVAREDP